VTQRRIKNLVFLGVLSWMMSVACIRSLFGSSLEVKRPRLGQGHIKPRRCIKQIVLKQVYHKVNVGDIVRLSHLTYT
jgi:hypothetical protein